MKHLIKPGWLLALLLFCGITQQSFSQSLKEFFSSGETQVTYLGIDFTQARLINSVSANPSDIKNRIYRSINDVVVNEPKKFDFNEPFHKSNISNDLTAVHARNEKINAEEIVSSNTDDFNRLKESDMAAAAKGLNLSGKKGIGILFVFEAMKNIDKGDDLAAVWTVLLDMDSKKVLLAERFEVKARGFGFRNVWASAIKATLDEIDKKKYKEWKSKYGS